ncbi:MAG: glycosyltransferase [Pseudomonadota bacterium]|nr:glycosyltransferase [Pseudomonadota bacterium]
MTSVVANVRTPMQQSEAAQPRIAVVLPCYNEAATIASVIEAFRSALPDAEIYVFDNNSTDGTAEIARRAGASVRSETRQGKGYVVQRIFADVEADIYVMADGDGTYDAALAPTLVELMKRNHVDMVVGTRANVTKDAGRGGHAFGNRIFNMLFNAMFGRQFTDIFSGYRVFSRRFAKSFPAVSGGFEIETEMSVHACQIGVPTLERPTPYGVRPEDSTSKLRTFRDGFRILGLFLTLAKETRPAAFFGAIGLILAFVALGLAAPLAVTYLETGLVPRMPTAILATGLVVIGTVSTVCGLILDSLARSRVEAKRSVFLSYPPGDWRS